MLITTGIFGNSLDGQRPTWRISAMNMPHFVSGGVQTDRAPYNTSLGDYQYVAARDNSWHSVVMVYDGSERRPNVFPLLQFYTDGRLQVGNARSDQGKGNLSDAHSLRR